MAVKDIKSIRIKEAESTGVPVLQLKYSTSISLA